MVHVRGADIGIVGAAASATVAPENGVGQVATAGDVETGIVIGGVA